MVVVQSFEMFGELEGGVNLDGGIRSGCDISGFKVPTSCSSTNGGPSAMSSLFVPGRILLPAPASMLFAPSMLVLSS